VRIPVFQSVMEIVEGDMLSQNTQAVVSAVHFSMLGAKGLDSQLIRAAGHEVMEECKALGGCDFGVAKITSGGKLRAKYIIHTAAPVYRGGSSGEAELLAKCYRNCLDLAVRHDVMRIAFPALGVGANGFPVDLAAKIAVKTVNDFLHSNTQLLLVRFVLNGKEVYKSFELLLKSEFFKR